MFRNIMVPIDGSAPSRRALKRAVRLAREQKARITGFYVGPTWRLPVQAEFTPPDLFSPKEHEKAVRKTADRVLGTVRKAASVGRVRCKVSYVMGDYPYAEILKAARGNRCDLIVIASHGRRGIARLLLGSETSKILAHADVPVLVCR